MAWAFIYSLISAISIFALIVVAEKYDTNGLDAGYWIAIGVFWPICLLPAVGYLAAQWFMDYFS